MTTTPAGYGFAAAWRDASDTGADAAVQDPEVLRVLMSYIGPGETVLDIAADSTALAAARAGAYVTVVDPSREKLSGLSAEAAAHGLTLELVQASWPNAAVACHDVAVSVGALRRHRNLPAALRAMALHADRLLLCVEDTGVPAPHERALAALTGVPVVPRPPRHLLVAGALAELGLTADVRIVTGTQVVTAADPTELLHRLAGESLAQRLSSRLLRLLGPTLSRTEEGGWQYRRPIGAGLVVCQV